MIWFDMEIMLNSENVLDVVFMSSVYVYIFTTILIVNLQQCLIRTNYFCKYRHILKKYVRMNQGTYRDLMDNGRTLVTLSVSRHSFGSTVLEQM